MLDKLRGLFAKITHSTVVDEALVKEITQDLQKTLIQSDVNLGLAKKICAQIEEKALKEKLPPGISRKEHLIKTMYAELVSLLGGEQYKPRLEPHKILLCGLYGSGKTTTVSKLARFYSKRGLKTCAIVTDTYRPAAFTQVAQLGEQVKIRVFGDPQQRDAVKILEKGLTEAKGFEIIIVDSAGRDSLNRELLEEISGIKELLKPEEIFLVISADTGQTAAKQAEQFHKTIGLTGVIATKTDTSGKAGGALSACATAGVPVAFVGMGEKPDDFEVFSAEKFVSRLLGFPDLGELLKRVKEAAEEAEFKPEDMLTGDYNLKTFYKQMEAMGKLGPLKKVFEMMGLAALPPEMVATSEQKMRAYRCILDSMTEAEKLKPELLNSNRIKRIAKGSGRTEQEVRELLKQHELSKKMLDKLRRGKRMGGPLGQLFKQFKGVGG